ncbi:hypothetical protein P280DRAFT_517517 [Massarina eburnea CBS 473.64]|uniref:Uncharacterized protein n=1 Tax=Massarina eburnea CBS 473.64 TaxID=1395130 RepID=A0A6A6S2E3_9PLEO|nr:hypothetical protein P280DRAFT_517517 [Massarina eburnea CBS 473.64]
MLQELATKNAGGLKEFDWASFRKDVEAVQLAKGQNKPMLMRLDMLESFLNLSGSSPKILTGKPGILTIVDLTDPVIDPESFCLLLDTCFLFFLSQTSCGKSIALEEAHSYMTESSTTVVQFMNRLPKTIREQSANGGETRFASGMSGEQ